FCGLKTITVRAAQRSGGEGPRNSAFAWGGAAQLGGRVGCIRATQRSHGEGRGVDGEGPAGRAGSDGVGYGGSRRSHGVDRRRGQIPLRGIVSSRKIPPCGIW